MRIGPVILVLLACLFPLDIAAQETLLIGDTWQAWPAGIVGELSVSRDAVAQLPLQCRDESVFYEISGLDAEQYARCRLRILYGKDGSSEAVDLTLSGNESKAGEVPSVASDPRRRLRVTCVPADTYRPMYLKVRCVCGRGGGRNDFEQELNTFLNAE